MLGPGRDLGRPGPRSRLASWCSDPTGHPSPPNPLPPANVLPWVRMRPCRPVGGSLAAFPKAGSRRADQMLAITAGKVESGGWAGPAAGRGDAGGEPSLPPLRGLASGDGVPRGAGRDVGYWAARRDPGWESEGLAGPLGDLEQTLHTSQPRPPRRSRARERRAQGETSSGTAESRAGSARLEAGRDTRPRWAAYELCDLGRAV